MICNAGDIVVVPFPFVDIAADKRRPSLIMSRQHFNRSQRHSICAMITTARHTRWPTDIAIDNLAQAGLRQPCVVRWKLFTLPNDLIIRVAGKLAGPDRKKVLQAAREIFL